MPSAVDEGLRWPQLGHLALRFVDSLGVRTTAKSIQ